MRLRILPCTVLPFLLSACSVADLSPLPTPRDARDASDSDASTGDTADLAEDAADSAEDAADSAEDAADSAEDAADSTEDAADLADTADLADAADSTEDAADLADTADISADTADAADIAADTADLADSTDTADLADGSDPDVTPDAGPTCVTAIATHALAASPHIAVCSATTYETLPPTSGPHYPIWAAFKTYGVPINPGFLVHSLEHGAVVINYRCDTACDAELAELAAFLEARPADPLCVAPLANRFIVSPRPDLDVRFAASAWGASLRSDCFDLEALGAFLDAYYAKAPENFCANGVDIEAIAPDSASYCPP